VVAGFVAMLAFWPYAQARPFRNPFRAWQKFSNFLATMTVHYEGQLIGAADVPRWYIPHMYLLNLPEFYFLAWLLGAASVVVLLKRRALASPEARRRVLQALWVLSLALVPVAWVVLRRVPLYNGNRHLLFVVPFLAVLAGVSVAVFPGRPGGFTARALAGAALLALLLRTAVDMVELHPYQYLYYNRLFAGGLARAADRYETDYWGATVKEGIEWVVAHYAERTPRRRITIGAYANTVVPFRYYLSRSEAGRRLFEPAMVVQDPDVVLAPTAYRQHEEVKGTLLHVVARQGAPLLYIFEVRPPE
jgi:hypothetical protein